MTPKSGTELDGALLAARYAYMPNRLRYCGGDSNAELFAHLVNFLLRSYFVLWNKDMLKGTHPLTHNNQSASEKAS